MPCTCPPSWLWPHPASLWPVTVTKPMFTVHISVYKDPRWVVLEYQLTTQTLYATRHIFKTCLSTSSPLLETSSASAPCPLPLARPKLVGSGSLASTRSGTTTKVLVYMHRAPTGTRVVTIATRRRSTTQRLLGQRPRLDQVTCGTSATTLTKFKSMAPATGGPCTTSKST